MQLCTIPSLVAAVRELAEMRPEQTARFSILDERGFKVPVACDSQLIGLMKQHALACMFEMNCDVLDVEAAATGSRPSILGQGGCSNPISSW